MRQEEERSRTQHRQPDTAPASLKQLRRRHSSVAESPKAQILKQQRGGAALNGAAARRRSTPALGGRGRLSEEPDSPPDSAMGSSSSLSLLEARSACGDDESDSSADNVKVLVRIRPVNAREACEGISVRALNSKNISLQMPGADLQAWSFDYVAGMEASQEELFEAAGQPLVENCMAGYNSSIFAYGQTGAGKTHTMQGSLLENEQRGLCPRVFEWLFNRITEEESAAGRDVRYTCRCSFLEIYNETITDLLKPGSTSLQLREDVSRGCFVDGLSEEVVLNVEEAVALIRRGAQNRRIGQTRMNQESSRSHSVFTCVIESSCRSGPGLTSIRFSRLNLVDLAGSERNKASGATGEHFKEACLINQSLTALGRVIMELVDAQRSKRHGHIPYRDSRLTFLLQDSLGGNAKSMIIANVSPAVSSCHETLSTLQFVSRAKHIRNKAIVNQDMQAESLENLKREMERLSRELELVRSTATEPLIGEVARLTTDLNAARRQATDARAAAAVAGSEAKLARTGAQWAEEKVAKSERERTYMRDALVALASRTGASVRPNMTVGELVDAVSMASQEASGKLQAAEESRDQAVAESAGLAKVVGQLREATAEAERLSLQKVDAAQAETCKLAAECAALEDDKTQLEASLQAEKRSHQEALIAVKQENVCLQERAARQDAEASGLGRQAAAIREELTRRDKATHEDRLRREETIRQLATERNTLQASLASSQAETLAVRHQLLEARHSGELHVKEQLKSLEDALEGSRAAELGMTHQLQALETQLRDRAAEQQSLSEASSTLQAQLQRKEKALVVTEAKLRHQEACSDEQAKKLIQLQTENADLHASISEKSEALAAAELALQTVNESLETLQRSLREQSSTSDALRQQLCQTQEECKQTSDSLAIQQQENSSSKRELGDLRAAKGDLQSQIEKMQAQHASQLQDLQNELQSLAKALKSSRDEEVSASSKVARLKQMLTGIDNIVKLARSPSGTPTGAASMTAPSFRKGAASLPSTAGNHNPLYVAQWGASSPSHSQEWQRQSDLPTLSLPAFFPSRAMSESWAKSRGSALELLVPDNEGSICDGQVEIVSPSPGKSRKFREGKPLIYRRPSIGLQSVAADVGRPEADCKAEGTKMGSPGASIAREMGSTGSIVRGH